VDAATTVADVTAAEEQLDALRLRDWAAGIGAELHLGDDCPVCRRQLPADFEHASGTSAAELRAAKTLVRDAKTKRDTAVRKLADAQAAVAAAETAVSRRAEEHRTAQQNSQHTTKEAAQGLADFASLAAEAGEAFDADTASAALTAATTALATHSGDSVPDPEQLTGPVVAALTACEQAAADRAERLGVEAIHHTVAIDAERNALNGRNDTYQKAIKDAKAASARHTHAVTSMTNDIRALPDWIQTLLPDNALDINAEATTAAAEAIAAAQAKIQSLLDAREAARTEKTTVLTEQRALDQETHARVDGPLKTLRSRLDAWANAVVEAVAHIPGNSWNRVPEAPAESGITEIRTFATALSRVATALCSELTKTSAAHSTRAAEADARIREQVAALANIGGFDPGVDPRDPQLLHPLVAARAKASSEAEVQRTAQRAAQAQVKPAADLNFAITAGQARLDALDVLRSELVDAKFLGHLTGLNTRALLGIASDLLGQLTDQRFGFADSFDIVSRSSGVVHTPNRLSGGEKFLASLALALALAELHSRGGPRLGSLFLDEGFAALDSGTLQSALDVLRAQAGGDRLVMVISHLHAVAEAVDDVLWVERAAAGSTARWLRPFERDELVQADLASGLQTLAQ
jgi:ATPase involved in DNA repair